MGFKVRKETPKALVAHTIQILELKRQLIEQLGADAVELQRELSAMTERAKVINQSLVEISTKTREILEEMRVAHNAIRDTESGD